MILWMALGCLLFTPPPALGLVIDIPEEVEELTDEQQEQWLDEKVAAELAEEFEAERRQQAERNDAKHQLIESMKTEAAQRHNVINTQRLTKKRTEGKLSSFQSIVNYLLGIMLLSGLGYLVYTRWIRYSAVWDTFGGEFPTDVPDHQLMDFEAGFQSSEDNADSEEESDSANFDDVLREKAWEKIESFREWIEENKGKIRALDILTSDNKNHTLWIGEVVELASRIARPPLETTPEQLWMAFELLEESGVNKKGGKKFVDMIPLVRHALDPDQPLIPFQDSVMERYEQWLDEQIKDGNEFDPEKIEWLDKIAEHVTNSLHIKTGDFEGGWFNRNGGLEKVNDLFGDRFDGILNCLNEKLAI